MRERGSLQRLANSARPHHNRELRPPAWPVVKTEKETRPPSGLAPLCAPCMIIEGLWFRISPIDLVPISVMRPNSRPAPNRASADPQSHTHRLKSNQRSRICWFSGVWPREVRFAAFCDKFSLPDAIKKSAAGRPGSTRESSVSISRIAGHALKVKHFTICSGITGCPAFAGHDIGRWDASLET
jgi:hypothetical protein